MSPCIPIAAKRFTTPCRAIRRALTALVPAVVLAFANHAQAAATDYYVTWNATDATANIEAKINQARTENPPGGSRIILEYHAASTPWYVIRPIVLDVPNMEFWIKGGRLMPKDGDLVGFQKNGSRLIQIRANNVKVNGYKNGVDLTAGRATLEMRKDLYATPFYTNPPNGGQGGRHCISIQGRDNAVIQGFYIVNAGGDGICVDLEYANGAPVIPYNHPYNTVIKQVICNGSYRNGISVISADKLTVNSSVFKNSKKTEGGPSSPQAGVDIEPSRHTDILKEIKFFSCWFMDNEGSNVEINPRELSGSGTVIDITFDACTISGGGYAGMAFYSLVPDVGQTAPPLPGPTGTILVKNTTISGTKESGLRFSGWGVDRVNTTMSNVDLIDCNPGFGSSVILWGTSTLSTRRHGEVNFINGCSIEETSAARPNTPKNTLIYVNDNVDHPGAGVKDIIGTIEVIRPAGSIAPRIDLGSHKIDCTLTVTP